MDAGRREYHLPPLQEVCEGETKESTERKKIS